MRAVAVAVAVFTLFLPNVADAQNVVVSTRLGVVHVLSESYDLIYGDITPTVGATARVEFGRRWSFAAGADMAGKEGEQVIYTPEPVRSGFTTQITLETVHLALGARVGPVTFDIGPMLLRLRETGEFDERTSATSYGGTVTARVERRFRSWWGGAEVGYMHVPNAFGPGGAAAVEDETDFAAVTFRVTGSYRFPSGGKPPRSGR